MKSLTSSRLLAVAVGGLLAFGSSCQNAGEGRVLGVTATGVVNGFVYLDRNGNRVPDAVAVQVHEIGRAHF